MNTEITRKSSYR